MLLGLIILDAACCLAAAGLLVRLWRPALPASRDSFTKVMAGLLPRGAQGMTRLSDEASPATATPACPVPAALAVPVPPVEGDPEMIEGLALSKRLAVLRHMLQGRTAAEAAAAEQVDVAAACAIFRAHRRVEG